MFNGDGRVRSNDARALPLDLPVISKLGHRPAPLSSMTRSATLLSGGHKNPIRSYSEVDRIGRERGRILHRSSSGVICRAAAEMFGYAMSIAKFANPGFATSPVIPTRMRGSGSGAPCAS